MSRGASAPPRRQGAPLSACGGAPPKQGGPECHRGREDTKWKGHLMANQQGTRAPTRAVALARQGYSYRAIGEILGIDESIARRDPEVRKARIAADPNAHSVTNVQATVACRVQPATELISRVEWTLASLLGNDYTLSTTDRRRLGNILRAAQEGLNR